jgi:hypothetical protein
MMEWAKRELDLAGFKESDDPDDIDNLMRNDVLKLLEMFVKWDHSGFSANYAIKLFQTLANWKPLSPLTGESDEWTEVGPDVWQNKRASNVFKGEDGRAYWNDGIVFWEWFTTEEGEPYKSYFTSRDSRVFIDSFPWTMPEKPEYREYVEVKE